MTWRRGWPMRVIAACALAAGAVAAPAAQAATCPLLRDRPGDGGTLNNWGAGWLPEDRSLDLVSLDVASNRTRLLAVVRVNRLSREKDQVFHVWFDAGRTSFWLGAHLPTEPGISRTSFAVGYASNREDGAPDVVLGTVPGRVDMARSELAWIVDVRLLQRREPLARGTLLSNIYARSGRGPSTSLFVGADWTDGRTRHVFGSGGCVDPARARS